VALETAPIVDDRLPDRVDAVFLDAGGVLVTPDPDRVRAELAAAVPGAATPDDAALVQAHYRAMAAVDVARSAPETFDAYLPAYLGAIGHDGAAALAAARSLWSVPYRLWTRPLPGAADALAALAASGRPVVVVSNADGRVAEALATVLQVGPGAGVEVTAVVDSGVVGIDKPDPAIFHLALDAAATALGRDVDPGRVVHVGDAHGYDVAGARAAGVVPVFVDPLGLHPAPGCPVVGSLTEVVDLLG